MNKRFENVSNAQKEILNFTLVYNKHKNGVYNYVLKMVGSVMLSEDIVQNVFLKLFENLKNIRNRDSVKYWIFSTARNEVFTYFRRKKVHKDKFGASDSAELEINSEIDLSEEIELNEFKELLMIELEELPPEQKDVFLLKEYGGLSYREIAETAGIGEDLVKSRLFKTRQKLIKRISKKVLE